jgi:hypothetical protein
VDLPTYGLRGLCASSFGIRAQKGSFLSVVEKKRIHHGAKEKGQKNTRSTRGKGNAKKKR